MITELALLVLIVVTQRYPMAAQKEKINLHISMEKKQLFPSQRLTLGYTPDTQINLRFVTYNFPAQLQHCSTITITITIAISIALQ